MRRIAATLLFCALTSPLTVSFRADDQHDRDDHDRDRSERYYDSMPRIGTPGTFRKTGPIDVILKSNIGIVAITLN